MEALCRLFFPSASCQELHTVAPSAEPHVTDFHAAMMIALLSTAARDRTGAKKRWIEIAPFFHYLV